MSTYRGMYVKAIIKKEYRSDLEGVINKELAWEDCANKVFRDLANQTRAEMLPFCLESINTVWDNKYAQLPVTLDMQYGILEFANTIKNGGDIIMYFIFNTLATIAETAHIEVLDEQWNTSKKYEVKSGCVESSKGNLYYI
ncbi:hypothetical protein D3C81_07640 [compost metagenome]